MLLLFIYFNEMNYEILNQYLNGSVYSKDYNLRNQLFYLFILLLILIAYTWTMIAYDIFIFCFNKYFFFIA